MEVREVMYSPTYSEYSFDGSGTHIIDSHQGLILWSHMRSVHSRECSACLASEESFVCFILEGPEFVEEFIGCE